MTRRRTIGAVAGVLAVGVVAAAVTVLNLPPAESDDGTAGPPSGETVEVTRETLVDTESHDGTLGHGDTTTVAARAAGTVTGLPSGGTTVTRGKALYHLDNDPVTLLYGRLPAYRTLRAGLEGADVKQFERNLWALGYRGFTVDDEFTSATASAVEEWQDDLGRSETGQVAKSDIAYATGAVRVDSRTVEAGTDVQPGTGLLKVTGTRLVATVSLDADDQRLARRGAKVEVTLPDGRSLPGKITEVETVVEPGEGDQADTTVFEVTVGFGTAPRGMDKAAVTVAFTASERRNVLAVPVAALLALAEGGYGVQIVENGATRTVAVETGLFADGRVEVSGGGLTAGMRVGMPS
jgi:multidrug efflux pump subunit AcrA (membrane-fusion protein)